MRWSSSTCDGHHVAAGREGGGGSARSAQGGCGSDAQVCYGAIAEVPGGSCVGGVAASGDADLEGQGELQWRPTSRGVQAEGRNGGVQPEEQTIWGDSREVRCTTHSTMEVASSPGATTHSPAIRPGAVLCMPLWRSGVRPSDQRRSPPSCARSRMRFSIRRRWPSCFLLRRP